MRNYKYIGTFISDTEDKYEITVRCNGFIQALILLTAEAIRSGRHYQLDEIVDEKGNSRTVDDISMIGDILN